MESLLMPASLVLGLIAWIFPVINLVKIRTKKTKNWSIFSIASLIACSIALYFQILYSQYLAVERRDFSALMDILPTSAMVSAVLLVITIALNIITLIVYQYSRES